jgi:uncharacterized protein (TIGR03000 family)
MRYLLAAILSGALLLGSNGVALAQHGHGGGHGGGHAGSVNHAGTYHGGYSGHANYYGGHPGTYYHNNYYGWHGGNYYHNGYYNHGYYGHYWYPGLGLYFGLPLLFNYPWGHSYYDYGIGAPYYSGSYYYGGLNTYVPPMTSYDVNPVAPAPAESTDPTVAHIEVRLPANATLWIDGQPTTPTGDVRHFVTPSLAADKTFSYHFRAQWTDASGQVIDRTKDVDVKAGAWIGVDFNRVS